MSNYYNILEVKQTATVEEIKKSYRRLVKLYHPDKHQGEEKYVQLLMEVQRAYEVLVDVDKRARYDEDFQGKMQYRETDYKAYSEPLGPKINQFSCDQTYFFNGDEVIVSWDCENADYISISSFGYMTDLKGSIRYKIKNVEARYLTFEIKVRNNQSNQIVTEHISIENGKYKDFSNYVESDELTKKVYQSEIPWMVGFMAPLGRSSRRDYALRIFILVVCYLYSMWNADNFETEGMAGFLQTAIIFVCAVCSARRLHDFGQRAAWVFLFLIPYSYIFLIPFLLIKEGTKGPNRFGRPL